MYKGISISNMHEAGHSTTFVLFLDLAPLLALSRKHAAVTVKRSLLFFWFDVHKSQVIPQKGSIYMVDFRAVLISGWISKCQSAQLLKIKRNLPNEEKVWADLPLPPSSVLPEQCVSYWSCSTWWPNSRSNFSTHNYWS